jgi:hypothetical protein
VKLSFIFICSCIGLLLPARAAVATNEPGHPIRYFLFLVDTSSSMSQQKEIAMDTVHKLVLSSVNGRMKPGDVFTIWTFNDRVYTNRFAAQRWIPSRNQDMANIAYRFLRDQHFSRKTRMDLALAAMSNVVQRADAITVILFTDGSHLLKGTPFDEPINNIFNEHAEGMRNAKKPFVTAFTAQEGTLVAHAVSPGGGPIYIPPTTAGKNAQTQPKEIAGPRRETAEGRPNNRTEQNSPAPPKTDLAPPNRPKPLSVEQISALLRESQKKRDLEASTNAPAPIAAPPENARAETPKPEAPARIVAQEQLKPAPPPIARTEVAVADATTTPAVAPPVAAQTIAPERAPTEPEANTVSIQPKEADPTEKKADVTTSNAKTVSDGYAPGKTSGADVPSPASQTVMPPEPVRDSQKYLFLGLGLLAVALASAWLLLRNRRSTPQPSLISRSMEDGKK